MTLDAIIHDVKWRVEHRELQLLRAEGMRRPQRYIKKRRRMLEEARRELARVEKLRRELVLP